MRVSAPSHSPHTTLTHHICTHIHHTHSTYATHTRAPRTHHAVIPHSHTTYAHTYITHTYTTLTYYSQIHMYTTRTPHAHTHTTHASHTLIPHSHATSAHTYTTRSTHIYHTQLYRAHTHCSQIHTYATRTPHAHTHTPALLVAHRPSSAFRGPGRFQEGSLLQCSSVLSRESKGTPALLATNSPGAVTLRRQLDKASESFSHDKQWLQSLSAPGARQPSHCLPPPSPGMAPGTPESLREVQARPQDRLSLSLANGACRAVACIPEGAGDGQRPLGVTAGSRRAAATRGL